MNETETPRFTSSTDRWTLLAAVLGSGMVFLDSTVVTVALPRIGQELQTPNLGTLEAQQYVYTGYLLSLAALLVLAGALSDHHGRRRTFIVGLTAFAGTSALCGAAPTMELLIAFRVLQGAAGAILVPGSLSILTAAFEGERQGRAFGMWAGASAGTVIVGPLVGGALVDAISWRAAFLINVPIALPALWGAVRHVRESRDEESSGRFDWTGAAVLALGIGGIVFGLTRGEQSQWDSTAAWVSLAVGLVATAAVPVMMLRRRDPLIPPHLFRSRNFTVTNVSTLLIYGALYLVTYFASIHLQGTLGYNATAAGLATIPSAVFLALFSSRFGALAGRYGPRWFMAVGPAVMTFGVLWLARLPVSSDAWVVTGDPTSWVPPTGYLVDVLPGLVMFGIGLMIMVAPLTQALMTSVPVARSGLASAINNAISRVGPQLFGALIFVVVTGVFYGQLAARTPDLDVGSSEVRSVYAPFNAPPADAGQVRAEATRSASAEAFQWAMLAAGALLVAGSVVNAFGIRNEQALPGPEEAAEAAPAPGAA